MEDFEPSDLRMEAEPELNETRTQLTGDMDIDKLIEEELMK